MYDELSKYFNSVEFYEIIYKFNKVGNSFDILSTTNFLISKNIELFIATKDVRLIDEFNVELLAIVSKEKMDSFSANRLSNKLLDKYLKLKLNTNNNEKIKDYLYANIFSREFMFHGFNSGIEDRVKTEGINPNTSFIKEQNNDINTINSIFEKYGIKNVFGYYKINCEGKVSYSSTPSKSYLYAVRSPEWLSYFIAGSLASEGKEYMEKNYDACYDKVSKRLIENNFSEEDSQIVLSFLDKYWNIYANKTHPDVVIVNNPRVVEKDVYEILLDDEEMLYSSFDISPGAGNIQTDEVIDTNNAIYISMPKYQNILEYVNRKDNISIEYENDTNKKI